MQCSSSGGVACCQRALIPPSAPLRRLAHSKQTKTYGERRNIYDDDRRLPVHALTSSCSRQRPADGGRSRRRGLNGGGGKRLWQESITRRLSTRRLMRPSASRKVVRHWCIAYATGVRQTVRSDGRQTSEMTCLPGREHTAPRAARNSTQSSSGPRMGWS